MGFLGRLTGSPREIQRQAAAARDALDKLYRTDQEREADEARAGCRYLVVKWMQGASGQALARRILALGICGCWLALLAAGVTLAVVYAVKTGSWMEAARLVHETATDLGTPVLVILGFYFAALHYAGKDGGEGVVESIRKRIVSLLGRKG